MNAKTALKGKKRIKNCFMLLDCKTRSSYDFSTARHNRSLFSFLLVEALLSSKILENML